MTDLFLKKQSAFWQFQTITVSECCLKKLLPYIYILPSQMASPGNRHCASCIGALSFIDVKKRFLTFFFILVTFLTFF